MWRLIDEIEGTTFEASTEARVVQYAIDKYVEEIGGRRIYRQIGNGDQYQIDVGRATLLTVKKIE